MADPPRFLPRPAGQPPPLPPRPITPEPFLDLTADVAPDTLRIRRDEEPPPPLPLTEETARALRRDLVALRSALPAPETPETPGTPGNLVPESLRTATKRAIAARVGKWSGYPVVTFLLPLVGAYVAQRWPDYAALARWALGWLP
jgi:hypothetical protein